MKPASGALLKEIGARAFAPMGILRIACLHSIYLTGVSWGSPGGFCPQHPISTEMGDRETLLIREGCDKELAMAEMVDTFQGVRD